MSKAADGRFSSESVQSSDISSLDINDAPSPEASHGTIPSPTDRYKEEKLFLLCHGCVGAVMIQFERTCDLSSLRFIVSSRHSTFVLTTCRSCMQDRAYQRSQEFWCPPRPEELFDILRLPPLMIEQMHAFQVMQVISRGKVLILTHKEGVAYETWNTIFTSLPEKSVCSGIVTDMRQGLVRDRLILPYMPASFL